VAALLFSSFRRTQAICEIRYEGAYLLWDKAGVLWTAIGRNFKTFKRSNISPNEQGFFGDDRFTMAVSLERASITDNQPHGTIDKTIETFADFVGKTLEILELDVLTRVGNRYLYSIECKSMEDARQKARGAIPHAVPKKSLFSIEPNFLTPTFKIDGDDGELAFVAQLYPREQKLELSPPPEATAIGVEKTDKTVYQVMLDIDFSTKKPIPKERFDAKTWLQGWNKTITREADAFLTLAEKG
jgi:hypothetical protein